MPIRVGDAVCMPDKMDTGIVAEVTDSGYEIWCDVTKEKRFFERDEVFICRWGPKSHQHGDFLHKLKFWKKYWRGSRRRMRHQVHYRYKDGRLGRRELIDDLLNGKEISRK